MKKQVCLSVDYIGIIPLLVSAINEQQNQIEEQQKLIEKLLVKNDDSLIRRAQSFEAGEQLTLPQLLQNVPNPFNVQTEIGYFIPKTVNTANLYIYDLNGVQQKKFSIFERGNSSTILQASALQAGIYFYTLICDGKPIDTKQMILTK